jgi:hypothetical protein
MGEQKERIIRFPGDRRGPRSVGRIAVGSFPASTRRDFGWGSRLDLPVLSNGLQSARGWGPARGDHAAFLADLGGISPQVGAVTDIISRLTNGFSKEAGEPSAIACRFAFYRFCRVQSSAGKASCGGERKTSSAKGAAFREKRGKKAAGKGV